MHKDDRIDDVVAMQIFVVLESIERGHRAEERREAFKTAVREAEAKLYIVEEQNGVEKFGELAAQARRRSVLK